MGKYFALRIYDIWYRPHGTPWPKRDFICQTVVSCGNRRFDNDSDQHGYRYTDPLLFPAPANSAPDCGRGRTDLLSQRSVRPLARTTKSASRSVKLSLGQRRYFRTSEEGTPGLSALCPGNPDEAGGCACQRGSF